MNNLKNCIYPKCWVKLEHVNFWLICKLQAMFDGDQVLRKSLCQIKHTQGGNQQSNSTAGPEKHKITGWVSSRKFILTAELSPIITRKQLHNMGRTQCSRENKGINYSAHWKKPKRRFRRHTTCYGVQLGTISSFCQFLVFCSVYNTVLFTMCHKSTPRTSPDSKAKPNVLKTATGIICSQTSIAYLRVFHYCPALKHSGFFLCTLISALQIQVRNGLFWQRSIYFCVCCEAKDQDLSRAPRSFKTAGSVTIFSFPCHTNLLVQTLKVCSTQRKNLMKENTIWSFSNWLVIFRYYYISHPWLMQRE